MASTITAILNGLFTSASKLVFLMISATVCAAFLMSKLDAKDFMILAIAVFSFYFGKPSGTQPAPTPDPADPASPPPLPPTTVETHITSAAPATVPGVK